MATRFKSCVRLAAFAFSGVLLSCSAGSKVARSKGSNGSFVSVPGNAAQLVAANDAGVYSATGPGSAAKVSARDYLGASLWTWDSPQPITALAAGGSAVIAATRSSETASIAAALLAIGRQTSAPLAELISNGNAQIRSIAVNDTDIAIGGSFEQSLRIQDRVVTSEGGSDGFVARLSLDGKLHYLTRIGGASEDNITSVALRDQTVVAGGTFVGEGSVGDRKFTGHSEAPGTLSAVVAAFTPQGDPRWATTFGGDGHTALTGLVIVKNTIAVAATLREQTHFPGLSLTPKGAGDAAVAWYDENGHFTTALTIGGDDFDGATAVFAHDDQLFVGGWCSGVCTIGSTKLNSVDGNAAFVARINEQQNLTLELGVSSAGHESVAAVSGPRAGALISSSEKLTINGQASDQSSIIWVSRPTR